MCTDTVFGDENTGRHLVCASDKCGLLHLVTLRKKKKKKELFAKADCVHDPF